jgi:imidazolonepropionase-like amidohydrolase
VRIAVLWIGVFAFLAGCTSQPDGDPDAPGASAVLFEGARLFAGDGSAVINNAAFIVEDGRFTAVGRAGDLDVPEGAARVDLSGKTVIPALIDLHAHPGYLDVAAMTDGP